VSYAHQFNIQHSREDEEGERERERGVNEEPPAVVGKQLEMIPWVYPGVGSSAASLVVCGDTRAIR